jgi:hypothetical protein
MQANELTRSIKKNVTDLLFYCRHAVQLDNFFHSQHISLNFLIFSFLFIPRVEQLAKIFLTLRVRARLNNI